MRFLTWTAAVLLTGGMFACGATNSPPAPPVADGDAGQADGGGSPLDAGQDGGQSDAGSDGGADGGAPDGGAPDGGAPDGGAPDGGARDGGLDAGQDGGPSDAGLIDAGPPDSGLVVDAGTDGGQSAPCAPLFAGCAVYTDATAAGASRTIAFTFVPSPQCLKVKAGQSVTFSGPSVVHPLSQACGPSAVIPFSTTTDPASFVFSTPGDYGYYCNNHGTVAGAGMAGSIQVVP